MGTESLKHLADLFSRRFFLNALLPTLFFTSIGMAIVTSTAWSTSEASAWWNRIDLLTRLIVVLVYLASIYFLATAVASQWRGIVRLFEGYPLQWLPGRLGKSPPGTKWHQEQLDRLEHAEPLANTRLSPQFQAYYRYPRHSHRDDVLPTRLGNILLSGERYPLDKYGIDSIIFWPRLYPLLPETFQREHEGFEVNYEFPLVVAFEAVITGLFCAAAILWSHGSPMLFAATFFGGLLIAYAAYCFALSSAEEIAEQYRVAFDLYRDRLLDAWPTVRDVADENEAFKLIHRFVYADAEAQWEKPQARHQRRHKLRDQSTGGSA
jgi:hypothetical protein